MPVKVELLQLGDTSAPAQWKEKKSYRTAVYISAGRWDQIVEDPASCFPSNLNCAGRF